jgi:hypothetical protein
MFCSDVASRNVTSASTAPAGTVPPSARSVRRRADDRPRPTDTRQIAATERPTLGGEKRDARRRATAGAPAQASGELVTGAHRRRRPAPPVQRHSLRETRGAARTPGEQLPAPAAARKPLRPVADDGRQSGHHLPTGNRDAVPAVNRRGARLSTRVAQQVRLGECGSRRATRSTNQRAESQQKDASGDHERGGRQRFEQATARGAQNDTAAHHRDVTIPRPMRS